MKQALGLFAVMLMVVCAVTGPARGDKPSKEQIELLAKQKLVVEIYKTLKFDQLVKNMAAVVAAQVNTEIRKKDPAVNTEVLEAVTEIIQETYAELLPDLMRFSADSMVRHFTLRELGTMLVFYRTSAGQKAMVVLPKMTQEMLAWLIPRSKQIETDLASKLKRRLGKMGYRL